MRLEILSKDLWHIDDIDFNVFSNEGVLIGKVGFTIKDASIELSWFEIQKEFRGQGLASKLGVVVLAKIKSLAKMYNKSVLTLECWPCDDSVDFSTESVRLVTMYSKYFGCTLNSDSTFYMTAVL